MLMYTASAAATLDRQEDYWTDKGVAEEEGTDTEIGS